MQFKPLKFISSNPADKEFITVVRQRVDAYFNENNISKKFNAHMVLKSIIMLLIYFIPFLIYIYSDPSFSISILLWTAMAMGMAGIGMSIMHDANHGAYTSSFKWNQWIGYTINFAGAFAANWKIQHNILHHTYTNISEFDDDIDDKAILKLSPHTPSKRIHRFQHIYAFFFYSIATIYWTFFKDFLQFERYHREGHYRLTRLESGFLFFKLLVTKSIYLFIILALPSLYFQVPLSKTMYCFIWMHLLASTVLTIVFQLAHTVDGTAHPLPNTESIIENEWAIHQVETTVNFAPSNRFITWFVGGLNYQIEHHLFPNICHIHYPDIAPIVRDTTAEFKILYLEYSTISEALYAHVGALKRFGG
jgi:linoleoyl-CoA desaturase